MKLDLFQKLLGEINEKRQQTSTWTFIQCCIVLFGHMSNRCRSPVVALDAKDGSVIFEVPTSDYAVQASAGHVAW